MVTWIADSKIGAKGEQGPVGPLRPRGSTGMQGSQRVAEPQEAQGMPGDLGPGGLQGPFRVLGISQAVSTVSAPTASEMKYEREDTMGGPFHEGRHNSIPFK